MSPWYPLERRLGGPQSWSGHNGKEKFPCPCRKSNPSCQAFSLVTILIKKKKKKKKKKINNNNNNNNM